MLLIARMSRKVLKNEKYSQQIKIHIPYSNLLKL